MGPSFKLKDLHITTKKRTDVAPVRSPVRVWRVPREIAPMHGAYDPRGCRIRYPDPRSRPGSAAARAQPVRGRRRSARRGPAPCQQERARLERTALRRPPRRDAVRRDTVPALNTHHTMQVARRHSKVVNTVRLRASCLMLHASTVTIGSCPILSRSPGTEPRDFVFDGFWEWLSFIEHGGERGCDCVARTTILDGSMSRWLH